MITAESAEELKNLTKEGNVVIYYSASWCVPCKTIKPVIKALSIAHEGKVTFVNVDIEKIETNIKSIPCFVFVKDGIEERIEIGLKNYDYFEKTINEIF
jgi:thioredoxin 1